MIFLKRKNSKKNKKRVIILILLVVLFISASIGIVWYIKSKKLQVNYKKEITVLLGEELYNVDEIDVKNGNIKTDREKIDTSKIGTTKITITIEDNFGQTHEYERTQ